jgi:phospholipid/cholesterol/gamma-HCH transport system substrate-binding protein
MVSCRVIRNIRRVWGVFTIDKRAFAKYFTLHVTGRPDILPEGNSMATRAQKVRLSVFLIGSIAVFLLFFLVLIGNRYLQKKETYNIVYHDVSITGLEPGAAVKLNGVPVGRVTGLAVETAAAVKVTIEVERKTPIKTDTEAVLNFIGVTGLKYVELVGGSEAAPSLLPGSTIKAGRSLLDALSGQANVLISKFEIAMNNINSLTGPENSLALNKALTSIAGVSAQLDTLFKFTRPDLVHALAVLDSVMVELYSSSVKTGETISTLNALLNSNDMQATLANTRHITESVRADLDSAKIIEVTQELNALLKNTNTMVNHYDLLVLRGRDDILKALRNLEETLDNLRETTDIIRENPSVLIRGRPAQSHNPEQ